MPWCGEDFHRSTTPTSCGKLSTPNSDVNNYKGGCRVRVAELRLDVLHAPLVLHEGCEGSSEGLERQARDAQLLRHRPEEPLEIVVPIQRGPSLRREEKILRVADSVASCRPALPRTSGMDSGLRAGQHAYRPYAASLPVRVPTVIPTVKVLFPASFGLTARLTPRDFRSAVPYGYLHRSWLDRFILLESAHAGHTGARILSCRVAIPGDILEHSHFTGRKSYLAPRATHPTQTLASHKWPNTFRFLMSWHRVTLREPC